MDKVKTAVKSRTAWTIIAMFFIGGVEAVTQFIPGAWLPLVQGALGLLAIYFRVNRKADA